jgi:HAD superfamily hydrolase (TIGR01509 family)
MDASRNNLTSRLVQNLPAQSADGLEAVLFDFDGVLVDSEPLHFACWREMLEPLGGSLDWQGYLDHCNGVADSALFDFFAGLCSPPLTRDRMKAYFELKQQMFRERISSGPLPVPAGLCQLIPALAGSYRLGVVTSSGRADVEPVLAAAGLRVHFGALICAEDVGQYKPAPEPYLKAAARLEVKRALVVEDSAAGVASGLAAGFEVLRITHPSRTAEMVRTRLGLP